MDEGERIPVKGVDAMLIPTTEVTMMEFLPVATDR